MNTPIRVALADDHALFRQGLKSLLVKCEGVDLVLLAEHGQDLLDQMASTPVDVVLLDLEMPVLDGLETTKRLTAQYPDVKIIVLTMHNEERMITYLMELGVHSYLLKDTEQAELTRAVHDVMERDYYFNDYVAHAMRKGFQRKQRTKPRLAQNVTLTKRETEVLQLIAEELTTPQIAERLFISPRTVEGHRENIMQKLGAKNTAGLILKAIRQSLITP